jgi:D-3-phosphoglycerate dehydrogenase / 2-oxoglutarate reductase
MDVLICEDVEGLAIQKLSSKYAIVRDPTLWKDAPALKEQFSHARAVMIRNQTQITAQLLAEARSLLAIGRVGVGLDNIDVKAATDQGVVVIAPLNANAISVAELTIGLLLALARKIPFTDRSTRAGAWDRKGSTGIELAGKKLAICGFGRIGRLVAARARAFGLSLLVFDPFVKAGSPALAESGATLCDKLEDALAAADFVTIHMPLTAETKHLFGANAFAAMKRGAFFINTSRGPVMDEAALVNALQHAHLRGAALDVRETEPPVRGVLENFENVILTPHVGAFTVEAQARTLDAVCDDLDRILSGQPAINYVNTAVPKNR